MCIIAVPHEYIVFSGALHYISRVAENFRRGKILHVISLPSQKSLPQSKSTGGIIMKRGGFTIVELMIVIVVIGILSAIMIIAGIDVIASSRAALIEDNMRA